MLENFGTPQEQSLGMNPYLTTQTQQQLAESLRGRVIDQQPNLIDLQANYVAATEPLAAMSQNVGEALSFLDLASDGPERFSDQESSDARALVNRTIADARQYYFTTVWGRTDAPGEADMEVLNQIFPLITDSAWRDNRESVRFTLQSIQNMAGEGMARERVRLSGQARGDPGAVLDTYGPRDQLPSGWSVD